MTLQEYNDLYKLPILKSMTITSSGGVTITNTNIVSEKMSLEKSLCSEENLRYGRCEAACFKITIADISHDFTGETLYVVQDIQTDGEGYLITENGLYILTEDGKRIALSDEEKIEAQAVLGYFKVFSDKPTNDRRWRELTCYDAMYDILNADVATWYNGLTFPMTIKNLRDSFFTYLGITQETVTLVNDSFVTMGGFSVVGTLSGKTVIEAICELNGVFGQITPSGTFDYVSLVDAETLTLDYYVDGTGSYEDYTTDYITGINARGTATDVGTFVGTDTNIYVIENNPLIYGTEGTQALETALGNLLDQIETDTFRPFTVQTYGNPMLPLGTKLTIVTRNMTIVSHVLRKEMTGIQALRDKYTATSEKSQPALVNNATSDIKRTKGKVHELEVDVNGLTSRVTATETNLSTNYSTTTQTQSLISQSESSIMTSVSQNYVNQTTYNAEIQNLQDQIDGRIEYYDGNVVPTLNNPPASSWTTTAAKDSHVGDLYRYHYTDQGIDKTDYYRFDKDTSTTPATYSWVTLGESEADEALRQAEIANQKADAAQSQLDLLQANVQNNYSTTTQMNSAIQVAVDGIESTVSEAVSKYDETALPVGVSIDYYGFGTPSATQYPPASCSGDYYLDNNSGTVYSCNGTAWSVVSGDWNPLPLITDEIGTSITQTKNTIVLKAKSNGDIVKVAIGTSAESGEDFSVKANNIAFISSGKIQLTSNSLAIESTNFKVTSAGAITATSGTIGGWSIGSSMLYKAVTGDDGYTYRPMVNAPETPELTSAAFAIRKSLGSSNVSFPFRVDYNGALTATGANITGTFNTDALTATGGTVGGWTINATQIRKEITVTETISGSNVSVTYRPMLNAPANPQTGNIAFGIVRTVNGNNSYPFRVNYNGALTATGANISGTINTSDLTATGGTVGGWTLTSGKIYGGDSSTGVAVVQKPSSNTTWVFAAGGTSHSNYGDCPFRVSKTGAMYSTSGNIAGFEINSDGLYHEYASEYSGISSGIYAFVAGSPSKNNFDNAPFRVSRVGYMITRSIYLTGNSGDELSEIPDNGNIILNSNATYGSSAFFHDESGNITVSITTDSRAPGVNIAGTLTTQRLICSGTKSRIAKTEDYGNRALYCYEMPTPMFGDVGEGKIAEDGKCYIWLDSTFSETIKTESYQVFLQKYGQGECYVTERTQRYFVVEGTAGMSFGWEIKARQAGFENLRLETFNEDQADTKTPNYGAEAVKHLQEISNEREVA